MKIKQKQKSPTNLTCPPVTALWPGPCSHGLVLEQPGWEGSPRSRREREDGGFRLNCLRVSTPEACPGYS